MGEKKKPGRFTLQFNLEDPQQRTVSELLEQQGRHKAQFITSAVLLYTRSPNPPEHSGDTFTMDEATLTEMLMAIMENHPRFAAAAAREPIEAREPSAQTKPAKGPCKEAMGDDALSAIADTLAAFQQG